MKLFHQLLVAPAALSLLAPIAVNASETINLDEMNSYSRKTKKPSNRTFNYNTFVNKVNEDLASTKSRTDALEAKQYNFEAGGFSDTTVASQTASFLLSAAEGQETYDDSEAVMLMYYYGISLDTSFNGDDNLNVVIETGNTESGVNTSASEILDFGSQNADELKVVDVNYTRSFGDLSLTVGDSLDASSQFAGACAYSGFTDHLADCGTGLSAGIGGDVSLSASYDFGNGLVAGFGATGAEGSTADGLFTEESVDAYAAQVAYNTDSYGVALTYAELDSDDATGLLIGVTQDNTVWGFNGYYTLDSYYIDSISAGYETADPETGDGTDNWFAGVTSSEVGPGVFNIGIGTTGQLAENDEETLIKELSYAFDVSDSQAMTVGVFAKEQAGGKDDFTGVAMSTTFSF